MKLRQLQCLCAVVDAGYNISRAAAVLHATQPAVSKQLRQFEEELGVDLVLRQGGRPVALTAAGEGVLAWARRGLQCADNIRQAARAGASEEGGRIAIATSHAHANYMLLPAIAAFRRRHPRVQIDVLQGGPSHVAELVRDGKVAIGVTHLPEALPKEAVAIPFQSSGRVLVAPPGHELLEEVELTLERIAAFPIIIQHSLRSQGARILRRFQERGLRVHVAVQAVDADVIKTYVAAGLGIGIIPAFCYVEAKDRELRARDVAHLFDPAVSAVLLRRHSFLQPPMYRFLAELDPALERRRLERLIFEAD